MRRLALFLAALWWGGISGLSFLAVPTLFAQLGSPAVAGPVAARLFSLQCYAGLLIGMALLVLLRRERGAAVEHGATPTPEDLARAQQVLATMGFVLLGMMLALVQEFGVAHQIVTARASGGNLRLWHGLGSVLVFGQWLCAGAILWRLSRETQR
ncbi:MAG: DUF4149 domain-containing protein [Hydrogenophaga sp.]|jgi:hypothetical protein|uniref:DUF4149 domain-containing protein n=1 Tax=Hydrogenophaga sp. TaxID=1904254 RepID=UPI002614E0DA|nr:DUF4149 domain-containing protein [Hydrogenophaga sp.]MDD3784861.1 DUF4149 domain-containing protein [Hydrogenophaga sp.]MDX9968163.1 DUF4149 domain-containing protein [Hydrogenophaga sp.]